uniref:Very low-density lipoprotein receptor n=1 Tax=Neogobius melanostomus TaxID=47308 RepID=A0A8C6T432_9GOBI
MGHLGILFTVILFVSSWDHLLGTPHRSLCKDGSDEQECADSICKGGEFSCGSGHCISVQFLCDGEENCDDGSDETLCQNCTYGVFPCGLSRVCLDKHQLCDGTADCEDGRDEDPRVCGSLNSECAASEFQCDDGQCIRHVYKCDNTADCSDGSDEENCDVNECLVNNGGCPYMCVDEPQGFHCECPNNTRLVGDNHCEEINHCLEADVCDQLCFYTTGHLTCSCQEEYMMRSAAGECTAKGNAAQLFITDIEGVHRTNITGSMYTKLKSLSGRRHMTLLACNNTLYWAQQGLMSIYRFPVDGKPQDAQLVLEASSPISGLAVDWIHGLLYWPSADAGSIQVSLLDGSVQQYLLTGLDKPCAVAVDPTQGVLFWAECGKNPKIVKSSLDGRSRKTLVSTLIHRPVALSLDMPRQLLYWVDQGLRRISRVNLEGHHRKTVVESNGFLDQPSGLSLFEGFVYWSDELTHSTCRASKHNGRHFQVVLKNITSPGSVIISHSALQPNREAACREVSCQYECAVSVVAQALNISCTPENGQNRLQGLPASTRTVPLAALSDSTFAGLLSLTMLLIAALLGMFVWWCREEVWPRRQFDQSLSLKESRDPLILESNVDTTKCPTKETLFKLDLDGK